MKNDTIGVDVSKDHLDAHRLADGATRRFANTKGGHKALIKWLTETPLYRSCSNRPGPIIAPWNARWATAVQLPFKFDMAQCGNPQWRTLDPPLWARRPHAQSDFTTWNNCH